MTRVRRGIVVAGWVLATTLAAGALVVTVWLLWVYATLPEVGGVATTGPVPDTAFIRQAGCPAVARDFTPLDDISPIVVCAVVRAEDRRFFRHEGVDWRGFRGALEQGIRAGEIKTGGSTIAMQLARNLFLSRGRTATRKARELALAPRLVERLGRRRVLELYLNVAEWAPCVYGAAAASRHWFGRPPAELDVFEATLLAILLPRPQTA